MSESEEAFNLVHELSALTGESPTSAVVVALREHLRHKRQQVWADRTEALGRALRVSNGPGIPANHCWDDGDRQGVIAS